MTVLPCKRESMAVYVGSESLSLVATHGKHEGYRRRSARLGKLLQKNNFSEYAALGVDKIFCKSTIPAAQTVKPSGLGSGGMMIAVEPRRSSHAYQRLPTLGLQHPHSTKLWCVPFEFPNVLAVSLTKNTLMVTSNI